MKKINFNKRIIAALLIIILAVFLIVFSRNNLQKKGNGGIVQSTLNDGIALFDKVLSTPLSAASGVVDSISQLIDTYDENKRLKQRIDNYAALQSENKNYKEENEQLREQLELNDSLENYEKATANVINRSPDEWNSSIVIDLGSGDGIAVNMPVMGNKGLIGRVTEVNNLSSKVELLTSDTQDSNEFPVMITLDDSNSVYGLLKGYDSKLNVFIISSLTSTDNVKEGQAVSTSGLGGNSPKGLYIGKVKGVSSNQFGLEKEVYVTPAGSLSDFSVVTVIKQLNRSEEE